MKTRFFWTCITVLAISPLVNASPDKDDMQYTNDKVRDATEYLVGIHDELVKSVNKNSADNATLDQKVKDLSSRLDDLSSKLDDLSSSLEELNELCKEKWGVGVQTNRKGSYLPWLLASVIVVILALVTTVFWRRRKLSSPNYRDSSTLTKCPLCGWERGPNDTVCKNPNCQIHF